MRANLIAQSPFLSSSLTGKHRAPPTTTFITNLPPSLPSLSSLIGHFYYTESGTPGRIRLICMHSSPIRRRAKFRSLSDDRWKLIKTIIGKMETFPKILIMPFIINEVQCFQCIFIYIHNKIQAYIYTACALDSSLF